MGEERFTGRVFMDGADGSFVPLTELKDAEIETTTEPAENVVRLHPMEFSGTLTMTKQSKARLLGVLGIWRGKGHVRWVNLKRARKQHIQRFNKFLQEGLARIRAEVEKDYAAAFEKEYAAARENCLERIKEALKDED